jgi:hypothetical protein
MENKPRKASDKTIMSAACQRVNERGRKFFIFLFSYLLPHGQSLEVCATGKSLLSSWIALKATPPNDQQKYSQAKVRSIPKSKARIALDLGAPLLFGDRKIQ